MTIPFEPDWAIPPGETIRECMEYELAERLECSTEYLENILSGHKKISPEFAEKLEKVFNVKASFWLNLDKNYWDSLQRLKLIPEDVEDGIAFNERKGMCDE